MKGLSPRMRGRHSRNPPGILRQGFIPAHAGQTRVGFPARRPRRVYPRACGADRSFFLVVWLLAGLSPRMRGRQTTSRTLGIHFGFIPAHAGQTKNVLFKKEKKWVYPRACGADALRSAATISGWGLSPRMRGRRSLPGERKQNFGFIPAHAGQTVLLPGGGRVHGVYPRACGADGSPFALGLTAGGLSPRMRGRLLGQKDKRDNYGFIPAHAGQTPWPWSWPVFGRVYPRACGADSPGLSIPRLPEVYPRACGADVRT